MQQRHREARDREEHQKVLDPGDVLHVSRLALAATCELSRRRTPMRTRPHRRLRGQRRGDRVQRRIGLRAVRPAGLRHVGTAAAALAAERLGALRLTSSTALKRDVRSAVTPTTTPALPSSVTPTMATTPEPSCFLPSSARLFRSFISMPCTARPRNLSRRWSGSTRRPRRRPRTRRRPSRASCAHRRDRARACLRSSISAAMRAGMSSTAGAQLRRRRLRGLDAGIRRMARGVARQRLDAAHAGGHRALAASPRSGRCRPARFTCVPPHSSTDQPSVLPPPAPIDTTRTSSPYFSPNSARAPAARASSTAISRVVTSPFCSMTSLAMSSTRRSSSARDRLGMREVEAQPIRRHQRAALGDVIAEHLPQRLVQQMRRRVVGADRRAARVIDLERQRSARPSACPARPCRHARTGRRPSSACR